MTKNPRSHRQFLCIYICHLPYTSDMPHWQGESYGISMKWPWGCGEIVKRTHIRRQRKYKKLSQKRIVCLCLGMYFTSKWLIHRGWVTYICVNKLTITGSDRGLWPDQRQAIIWNNAGLLLIGPFGTNLNKILIEIHICSFKKFKKIHLNMPSGKSRPFCLGLNVLSVVEDNIHVYVDVSL